MTDDAAAREAVRAPARQALWIGEWQLAADLNQIAREGRVVRLEPKAMAVLLHLASRPQEVLGREELLSAVWPGVVVGDNALTQAVIKLRRALGDTAHKPTYVQAIAKKGYRLIADVRRSDPAAVGFGVPAAWEPAPEPLPRTVPEPLLVPNPEPVRGPRKSARRWPTRLAASMLAAALVLIGAARVMRPSTPPLPPSQAQAPMRYAESPRAAMPAVLVEPFELLGAGTDQALNARAINADLVIDLSKVSGLRVIGGMRPASPAAAENTERPRYVLSGTVQQEGNRLRLNVLLSDAQTGRQLWSERLDRHVRDLFEVQDTLVARMLHVLPVKVTEAETLRIAQRSTRNLQAYDRFVHAQAALLVRRAAQNEAARSLYWEAIGLDPAFARAYAGLAMTYALDYQQGWAGPGDQALARAAEFAQTAIQMRPDMPEAHWVLAFVSAQRRQHTDALRQLDDALRMNPSYADAYALKGGIYTYIGKPAQGVEQMQLALRLNPDAGSLYFLLLGRAYYFLGDNEQARFNLKRSLERNPENLEARIYLAATQWRAGDSDASRWQVNEIRNLEPAFGSAAWLANYPLTDPGERQRLLAAMTKMGL